jgi:chemotaxis signal transduction protein
LLGIIVDSVSEVVTLAEAQISDAPAYNDTKNKFISEIGKYKEKIIMLLTIDEIFESNDMLSPTIDTAKATVQEA